MARSADADRLNIPRLKRRAELGGMIERVRATTKEDDALELCHLAEDVLQPEPCNHCLIRRKKHAERQRRWKAAKRAKPIADQLLASQSQSTREDLNGAP